MNQNLSDGRVIGGICLHTPRVDDTTGTLISSCTVTVELQVQDAASSKRLRVGETAWSPETLVTKDVPWVSGLLLTQLELEGRSSWEVFVGHFKIE